MNTDTDANVGSHESALHPHALLELFEELPFREKVRKVLHGLKQPKESGEYKYARLQLLRLSAPASAVVVPVLAVLTLMAMAGIGQLAPRAVDVRIMEPEPIDKLEEIEEPEEPVKPPEPVEMEFTPDTTVNVDSLVPTPKVDFSPQPAEFDTVAIVKSPVIMKGIFGSRSPGARGKALASYGGSGATEGAVLRALRWLKKNQNSDGSWNKTKPAMTGMALLAFLAHGETPASEEFGATVEKAIRFLVDNFNGTAFAGRDGHDYSHPIATYALCEAYALTKVPMIKEAAEKATERIIQGQHASGGFNYNLNMQDRDDTSYMGWCGQALKAAYMAGLSNPGLAKACKRAVDGFKKNAAPGGGFGYTGPGKGGLTGVGVLCMQLLGASKEAECMNGLIALQPATFNWDGTGVFNRNYYWYYITQAKFHAGGEVWNAWNALFAPVLVKNQTVIPKAIEDAQGKLQDIGYWVMDNGLAGHTDGDVMNTALACLQLEVYYRYLPTYKPPEEIAEDKVVEEGGDIQVDIQI